MLRKRRGVFLAAGLFLLTASFVHAGGIQDEYRIKVPEFETPPEIDGTLENPVWLKGAVLENFIQFEPLEGAQPSEKTVAYIGHDRKNLYIAVRLSYEYRHGTVFHFGVDDSQERDEAGIFRSPGRYYFIKFSYWWLV